MKKSSIEPVPSLKTLVLVSGGIESTTLLHLEHRRGTVAALFIDYAQRAADCERSAAMAQCSKVGIRLESLDLTPVGLAFRRTYPYWQPHVPLPHRNLVLLSLALGFAEQHGAQRLCLALNREDADSYPSGSPAFIDHFRKLTANLSEIAIEAPLIGLNKAETIQLGYKLGVNFAYTYSCLLGRQQPCGRCPQCLKRRKAFAIAGQPDPAMNLAGIRP